MLTIDPRIALFDHNPLEVTVELVRLLVHHLGHERVLREKVVRRHEVAQGVGRLARPVRHVEAHGLEGSAVPGIEIDLPGTLGELGRERRVVDEVLAGRQSPVVGRRVALHERDAGVTGEFFLHAGTEVRPVQHPDVTKMREVRRTTELPKDRFGVAQHTATGERLVEHRVVADRHLAESRVGFEAGRADDSRNAPESWSSSAHEFPSDAP
jgi:hypothetical protein